MSRRQLPAPASSMEAKHANLLKDFLQLQNEFSEMEEQLRNAKLERVRLLAEVRFLKRKFKTLKRLKSEPNQTLGSSLNSCNREQSGHAECDSSVDVTKPASQKTKAQPPKSLAPRNAGLKRFQRTLKAVNK